MRRIFFILFWALLPAVVLAQADSSQCKVEEDEFREAQLIYCQMRNITVEQQPSERIYRAKARLQRGAEGQGILIVTLSNSWNFIDVREAYALINGERYTFQFEQVDQEIQTDQVVEQQGIGLANQELKAVAEADTLRVKAGRAVFRLPAEQMAQDAQFMLGQ